jgi:hypothetical protein
MVGDNCPFGDYFVGLSGRGGGFDALGDPLDFLEGFDGLVVAVGGSDDAQVVLFPAERVGGSVVVRDQQAVLLAQDAQRGSFTHSNIIMSLSHY